MLIGRTLWRFDGQRRKLVGNQKAMSISVQHAWGELVAVSGKFQLKVRLFT